MLDVCTDLGSDDRCTGTGDVCVALCDERETCATVDDNLRELSPWPTAPNGYCVVCLDP